MNTLTSTVVPTCSSPLQEEPDSIPRNSVPEESKQTFFSHCPAQVQLKNVCHNFAVSVTTSGTAVVLPSPAFCSTSFLAEDIYCLW